MTFSEIALEIAWAGAAARLAVGHLATKLFINEGYSELTLRRVAKDVNIRLSTLQHYFNSREALISALVDERIKAYRVAFSQLKAIASGSGEEQARAIITFLVYDCLNADTCKFFTQIWAIAFQFDSYQKQLFEMYDSHRHDLAGVVAMVRPDLDELECTQRATMISSMIEGSLIHIGHGLPVDSRLAGIRERMIDHLMALIRA